MKSFKSLGLAALVLSGTVQAASFDCAKAQTRVEKMICADAELSKLDEEMARAYATSLQDKSRANAARQTQRQWVKERNACGSAECVKQSYKNRLHGLVVTKPLIDATEIVSELSRRSHIAPPELEKLLSDCSQNQLSMNICIFRDFIAIEYEMQNTFAKALARLQNQCHLTLKENQTRWERARDQQCNKQADAEAEGGTMRPMLYNACRIAATKERITIVDVASTCDRLP
mgnify:CR=1 FL=1